MRPTSNLHLVASRKDSLIKLRCSRRLKERLAEHAQAQERALAMVVRDACTFYLAHQSGKQQHAT